MANKDEAIKMALDALEILNGAETVEGIIVYTDQEIEALRTALEQLEPEPIAWLYPEGLEALKNGKPWTAYGTKQEENNTPFYLNPPPNREPYAWVTFNAYGEEDDVWYENPEGNLLEGWTYKPLYDTAPLQRKPLSKKSLCEILDVWNYKDETLLQLCRRIEEAHEIKE